MALQLLFAEFRWGVGAVEDGVQLDLLDENSKIGAHIPFPQASAYDLVHEVYELLTPELKRRFFQRHDAPSSEG